MKHLPGLAIFAAVCLLLSQYIRGNQAEIFMPSPNAHEYDWVEVKEFLFNQTTIVGCYNEKGELWLATVGDQRGLSRFKKIYTIRSAHYMIGGKIVLAVAFQTVEGGYWSVMTRDGEYLATEVDSVKLQPTRVYFEPNGSFKVCGEDWSVVLERNMIKN